MAFESESQRPGRRTMPRPRRTSPEHRRVLSVWLAGVAALVVVMIVVGGATRLTDSGLSITEWDVMSGVLPPLSENAWQDAFDKYRQIPEYQLVNKGMSLEAFKTIYWWEWSHRFLGRLIGLAFFVPMIVFLARGMIGRDYGLPILALFVLGGLQGALGWYMVQSGLADRVDVSQYRLAAHLGLAFILLGALAWMVLDLRRPGREWPSSGPPGWIQWGAALLVGLVFIQIVLGAFVAGLDAGLIYNTWPLMDERLVPRSYGQMQPLWRDLFENHGTVQFNHRAAAYILFAAALAMVWGVFNASVAPRVRFAAGLLAGAILAQILLGIWTLLSVVPISLGLAHQAGAIAVYLAAIYLLHLAWRAAPGTATGP